MDRKSISERLQALKEEKGFRSVRAFALELNADPSFFDKIYKGNADITEKILVALQKKFGLNPMWIQFGETPKFYGVQNGNGNNGNDLAAAKDETINALKEHIQFLKGENERLRKQCESNLSGLHRYAQIVSARAQVIVECHKLLRAFAEQAKIDPKKIDAASEKVDRLFAATLQETIQSDKD